MSTLLLKRALTNLNAQIVYFLQYETSLKSLCGRGILQFQYPSIQVAFILLKDKRV